MLFLLLFLGGAPFTGSPPENGFCVVNGAAEPLLFAADAGEDGRRQGVLDAGEALCLGPFATPARGFVSVFTDADAVEGCSHLARAGQRLHLLAYADFDRCRWEASR